MLFKELSSNIKKYRNKIGLTQKELAYKICKSEISIRKYESGNVNIPPSTLFDICNALGVTSKELLGEDFDKYHLENFGETLDESLKQLENTIQQSKKIMNIKERTHTTDFSNVEMLTEEGIKEYIYSSVVDLMYLAISNQKLNYNIDNFTEQELEEISNFIYAAYTLKVNEILERNNNEK